MKSGLKISVTLFISVIFAFFAVLMFSPEFEYIEAEFYKPAVLRPVEQKVTELAENEKLYNQTLIERFASFLTKDEVLSFTKSKADDAVVRERISQWARLKQETPALIGLRIVDSKGRKIHFSTFDSDKKKQDDRKIIYEDYPKLVLNNEEVEFDSLNCPQDKKFKIFNDKSKKRIIFALPIIGKDDSEQNGVDATALFYCSTQDFLNFAYSKELLTFAEKDDAEYFFALLSNAGGYVFGLNQTNILLSKNGIAVLKNSITEKLNSYIQEKNSSKSNLSRLNFSAVIEETIPVTGSDLIVDTKNSVSEKIEVEQTEYSTLQDSEENSEQTTYDFVLFTKIVDLGENSFGAVSIVRNAQDFKISPALKVLLLSLGGLTLFLVIFLIFNLKCDDEVVIKNRIRKLTTTFIAKYKKSNGKNSKKTPAELTKRKGEFEKEIKLSLGRRGKKYSQQIDELLEESWQEILSAIGVTENLKPAVEPNSKKVNEKIELTPVEQPQKAEPAGAEVKVEKAEDPEEVEALDEMADAEPVNDLEESDDLDDVEPVEDLADAEQTDELEEVEDADVLEEVEPVDELEATDAEELDDADPVDDVEPAEELDEIEPVEDLEESVDLDEVELLDEMADAEPAEDLDEIEPVDELEEIGDAELESADELEEAEEPSDEVEEIDAAESAEELEEIEEAEPASDIDEVEALDDVEPVEEVADAEPVNDLDEVESLDEMADSELESADDLEEVADADDVEELEEVADTAPVDDADPATAPAEDAAPVDDVKTETTDVDLSEFLDDAAIADDLSDADDATPANDAEPTDALPAQKDSEPDSFSVAAGGPQADDSDFEEKIGFGVPEPSLQPGAEPLAENSADDFVVSSVDFSFLDTLDDEDADIAPAEPVSVAPPAHIATTADSADNADFANAENKTETQREQMQPTKLNTTDDFSPDPEYLPPVVDLLSALDPSLDAQNSPVESEPEEEMSLVLEENLPFEDSSKEQSETASELETLSTPLAAQPFMFAKLGAETDNVEELVPLNSKAIVEASDGTFHIQGEPDSSDFVLDSTLKNLVESVLK